MGEWEKIKEALKAGLAYWKVAEREGMAAADGDKEINQAINYLEVLRLNMVETEIDKTYYKNLATLYHDAIHKEAERRTGVEI